MLGKIVLISMLFVAVSCASVKRSTDISTVFSDNAELFEIAVKPESVTSLVNVVKSIIGYKISAVSLAGKIITWLSSNAIGIVIGGVVALGVCKITGKCNLNYDQAFSKLSSFVTSERLDLAQNLLMNAIRTYAEGDVEDEVDFEEE